MGSLRFDGVLFSIYARDHLPRHAHGAYAEVVVIVEFWPGGARLAERRDAIAPANAKRSDVMKVVRAAILHQAALNRLWEETHGA
jgi:hypothetical protein